jgi:solute carrier family 35 protein
LCKFFTVLISLVVFQKHASPGGLAALTVCLCAGAAYRPAPMRAAAAKDSAANTNNL